MMSDLVKMFDPISYSGSLSRYIDINQSITLGKSGIETWKKFSNIWFDTLTACADRQMKMYHSAIEDTIDCVKDMSTARGIEDLMGKQAEWGRKSAEKCQTVVSEIASTLQKGQSQCADITTKMVASTIESTAGHTSGKASAQKQQ